jgi:cytochrome P450
MDGPGPGGGTSVTSEAAPRAGEGRGWSVYEIALRDDPHAALRELRESDPVHDAGGGVFLVTRHADVLRVLRDPALRAGSGVAESFGAASGLLRDVMAGWLMALDGPEHLRARGLVSREFTPRRVGALAPAVEAIAGRLADALAREAEGHAGADLVRGLAFALPSEVIRHLFRIAPEEWSAEVEPIFRPGGGGLAGGAVLEALARYFQAKLERPGTLPPDGLLSLLRVADPEAGRLSDLEVVANCVLLVTAAIDTTTGLIANAVLCLLRHRGALEAVLARPALLEGAVEETLRYEPSALSASRFAPGPVRVGGRALQGGSHLLCSIAAANRDPRRFARPDDFDLTRTDVEHLGFGGGRHVCLGAPLARLEARAALAALLARLPRLELAEEPVAFRKDNPTVRAPARLLVRSGRA